MKVTVKTLAYMALVLLVGAGCGEARDGSIRGPTGGVLTFDAATPPDSAAPDTGPWPDAASVDLDSLATLSISSGVTGTCELISLYHSEELSVDGAPIEGGSGPMASWYFMEPGVHELSLVFDAFGCDTTFYRETVDVRPGDRYVLRTRGEGPGGEVVTLSNLAGRLHPLPSQLVLLHASSAVADVSWSASGPAGSSSGTLSRDGVAVLDVAADGETTLTLTDLATGAVYEGGPGAYPRTLPYEIKVCALRDQTSGPSVLACESTRRSLP